MPNEGGDGGDERGKSYRSLYRELGRELIDALPTYGGLGMRFEAQFLRKEKKSMQRAFWYVPKVLTTS